MNPKVIISKMIKYTIVLTGLYPPLVRMGSIKNSSRNPI